MKKLLLLLIFLILLKIGALIMFKPINAIINDSIGNIIYRGNVVTGIVATDNGDKSYDVFISESEKAYPHIFTLSANPNLAVGDKVKILYKNGCKELPIILPPTTGVISKIYAVYDDSFSNYYINIYSSAGVLLDTWTIEATENIGNALAVDMGENIYTVSRDQHSIRKRNSSGVLTLTKTETNYIYDIAVGPDGFIYTLEFDSAFNSGYLSKRNASDLVSIDTKTIDAGGNNTYYGLCIDANGYFYTVVEIFGGDNRYEKWDFTIGLIASQITTHHELASLAVISSTLASVHWQHHAITLSNTLAGSETDKDLTDINGPHSLGSISNNFIVSGYLVPEGGNSTWYIGEYDISLNKLWTIAIGEPNAYNDGSIGAYPF